MRTSFLFTRESRHISKEDFQDLEDWGSFQSQSQSQSFPLELAFLNHLRPDSSDRILDLRIHSRLLAATDVCPIRVQPGFFQCISEGTAENVPSEGHSRELHR